MKKITVILLLATIAISCTKADEPKKTPTVQNNKIFLDAGLNPVYPSVPAPDFTLTDLEGASHSLSDYKGEVVVLNFWAHWCGPCKSEMPSINNLYNKTKDMDIKIIAVNLGEGLSIVKPYIDDNSFKFDVLLDFKQQVGNLYGIRSIPTTYILDKEGNIVGGKLGAYEWDNNKVVELLTELAK